MDPIITSVVLVLGKYALDKGAELATKVGPKALETAGEMFALALDRLRRAPKGEVIAGEFEQDPETYRKPVEKALDAEVQTDPDFAAQLRGLLETYEQQAREHAAATGTTYRATVTDDGSVAQDRSAAAGAGGIAVAGDVRGGVRLSGRGEEKGE